MAFQFAYLMRFDGFSAPSSTSDIVAEHIGTTGGANLTTSIPKYPATISHKFTLVDFVADTHAP